MVGAAAVVALLLGGTIIYFARSEKLSDKYVIITTFPKPAGLKAGDDVIIDGKRVGTVQMAHEAGPNSPIPVRMKVTEEAFKSLDPDSVAWIEYSNSERKARVVIRPGKTDLKNRLITIKPIRGIEQP